MPQRRFRVQHQSAGVASYRGEAVGAPDCVHVSAEGPSGVLSTDPCASCFLSGEDRPKHINNMISRSGFLTNMIATIVATSRHLQSVVNNVVAGIATGSKGKIYSFP